MPGTWLAWQMGQQWLWGPPCSCGWSTTSEAVCRPAKQTRTNVTRTTRHNERECIHLRDLYKSRICRTCHLITDAPAIAEVTPGDGGPSPFIPLSGPIIARPPSAEPVQTRIQHPLVHPRLIELVPNLPFQRRR